MFIIQDKILGEETQLFTKACRENGISTYLTEEVLVLNDPRKYIIRGTIDFIEKYKKLNPYLNTILTVDNYRCSNYYQHFGCRMLNNDYLILPWWDLKNKSELIFQAFPNTEKFFIRPNEGLKIFTGTTLTKKWWHKELQIIKDLPNSNIKNSDLVLVSTAKQIISEYRVLMHKNNVVDYCRYSGYKLFDEEFAMSFHSSVIDFFPDTLYTMDIAATEQSWKILELNSFVAAGLYGMNYDKIIKYIGELYECLRPR